MLWASMSACFTGNSKGINLLAHQVYCLAHFRRGVAQIQIMPPHDPRHMGNGVVVEFHGARISRCQPGTFLWMAVKMIDSLGVRGQAQWFPKIMKQHAQPQIPVSRYAGQRFQRMLAHA